MDADATHPGEIIAELVEKIRAGADIAIASRFTKGGGQDGVPFLRSFLSIGATLFYRIAFSLRGVTDYTVNFRAYRSSLVNEALAAGKWPFLDSRTFSATVEYYEYILRDWYLFNTRTSILDYRFGHIRSLSEYIKESGWSYLTHSEYAYVFALDYPSTYLMKLHSDVLVIGRSSYYMVRLFPWVTEGRVTNPLEYAEEYIDLFNVIYLYDLPELNIAELEKRIEGWLRKGKTVILDLSVTDKIPEIFNVWHFEKPVNGTVNLVPTDDDSNIYRCKISVYLKEGRGAVYKNLDKYTCISFLLPLLSKAAP